jgi:hypothetical protein
MKTLFLNSSINIQVRTIVFYQVRRERWDLVYISTFLLSAAVPPLVGGTDQV